VLFRSREAEAERDRGQQVRRQPRVPRGDAYQVADDRVDQQDGPPRVARLVRGTYLVHRDLAHTTATSGSPPVHLRAHPISRTIGRRSEEAGMKVLVTGGAGYIGSTVASACLDERSEEHTSELQSRENLVCRLLLEK